MEYKKNSISLKLKSFSDQGPVPLVITKHVEGGTLLVITILLKVHVLLVITQQLSVYSWL